MRIRTPLSVLVVTAGFLTSCGSSDDGVNSDTLSAAVTTYADGVHASYVASLASATTMDDAVDAFVAEPTDATLDAAKDAWLGARDDYGPTEAFRFYNGPIDNEDDGPEGLINAWPMDEAYVDYVEGDAEAGIVNNPTDFPVIDAALLTEANEAGGETNISTGWHAVEFLLWGQDLSEDGPGERPVSDYVDAANADRRGVYLAEVSGLLLVHLGDLVTAWDPAGDGNYYDTFTTADPEASMTDIITGIGELSRGELAGERMNVAYAARSQEDEHSCFSDNTHNDIIANAVGVQRVLMAEYPGDVEGPSVLDAIREADSDLADQLEAEVAASVAAVEMIPAPFDQHLRDGVADSDPGRASILTGITALEDQTPTIVAAAQALGLTINVT
ncbi:MAG: putative iron-regulated protein [Candidatus Aldehydirespiratoraceae bacterium]|jgi:putative iron-regulated protein